MANYKTAMGKSIDMSALAQRNERTRAVGNMSVNARGDTIDATGKVVVPVTSKVSDSYAKTVGNRSAQVTKKPAQKIQADKPKMELNEIKLDKPKVDLSQLTPEEREFEEDDGLDDEIARIKAQENKGKK
jgi:hypothetical protein